ncbi:MAG: ABC transporter permease [Acidobacteriaceae bacterium]|nr:ABC transporter permease [Acidobacteriaceae bacterium]
MKRLRQILAAARNLFRRERLERDLDEEIRSYADLLADDKIAHGMHPDQARRAARMELGGVEQVKEEIRGARLEALLAALSQDVRYGARMLRKKPAFTAVATLTLAFGIGANSAIFSVMNASLLAPLPVPSPDRVVMVLTDAPSRGWRGLPASVPDYFDWKASGIFKSLAAFEDTGFNVRLGERAEREEGLLITPEWFDIQQVKPYLGRLFVADDLRPGRAHVALIAYDLWRSRFASNPGVVGERWVINEEPYTIIGVLPKGVLAIGHEVVYAPLVFDSALASDRGTRSISVVGRLAEGLTVAAAQQRISDLSRRLAQQYRQNVGAVARLQPAQEAYVEDVQVLVLLLFAAVAFVLLVACANIGNLLLVRGTGRRKEMAVRTALGATRWRLICQVVSESVLLAIFGGAVGVLPAWGGIRLFARFKLEGLPRPELVDLNGAVLVFTFLLALVTGILFALAPAWQLWTSDTSEPLKEAQRSNTASSQRRLGNIFVAGEIAVTVILLAGAGLMLRSFLALRSVNPGFETRGVLTMAMSVSGPHYAEPARQRAFYNDVIERLQRLPGVRAAAASNLLPDGEDIHGRGFHRGGRPEPKPGETPIVLVGSITPQYFRTLHIPVLRGRSFDERDRANAPLTVMIDQEAAQYWQGEDPIGSLIKLGDKEPLRQVVGIVGNVEQSLLVKLAKGRLGQVYLPLAQAPQPDMSVVVSLASDRGDMGTAVRAAIAAVDPDQPVFQMQTLQERRSRNQAPARIAAILLGGFAALALLLAAVGIYGVVSYTVGQRTREIGIRSALGASRADLLKLVLGNGSTLILAGAAAGLLGAAALTRLMRSLLSGISPNDPLTFAAVTFLLITVGAAATYIPARRATKVDPTIALRYE